MNGSLKFTLKIFYLFYPCRIFFRPCDNGKVNLVTRPSGPNTDGILSKESDKERESD